MELDKVALDRWITGNYGEDFFREDDSEEEDSEPDPDIAYDQAREERLFGV